MKLFKKVLAVVLVGAMAVSMLTACGSSKSSKVKDALKDFDIKMDAAMVQDTEKMMGGLQQLTEKVTSGAVKLNDETQMKKISEKFGEMTDYTFSSSTGKGDYDLYIWTNGADGRPASGGKTERYPYLMKVQNVHVSEKNLPRLLDKEFIQKGEFSGNSEALDILRSLLKVANVEKAGVSVGYRSCRNYHPADCCPQDPDHLISPIKTASGPGELAARRGFFMPGNAVDCA